LGIASYTPAEKPSRSEPFFLSIIVKVIIVRSLTSLSQQIATIQRQDLNFILCAQSLMLRIMYFPLLITPPATNLRRMDGYYIPPATNLRRMDGYYIPPATNLRRMDGYYIPHEPYSPVKSPAQTVNAVANPVSPSALSFVGTLRTPTTPVTPIPVKFTVNFFKQKSIGRDCTLQSR
jgi:hypothetical protein